MKKLVLFMAACVLCATTVAKATTVGLTVRSGSDTLDWGQLGACGATVPQNFNATSTGGVTFSGQLNGGSGERIDQNPPSTSCSSVWGGNFAPGDHLLWTSLVGHGPVTLTSSQPLTSLGAQIQPDSIGAFTAKVCDNHGRCFEELGTSNGLANNSAIFIGLKDLSGTFTSLTFSLTACGGLNCSDFGINKVSFNRGTPAPEPGTLMLLGAGLVGLAGGAFRKLRT